MTDILWTPSPKRVNDAAITHFREVVNARYALSLKDSTDLQLWSVDKREEFWDALWDFFDVIGDKGNILSVNRDAMPGCQFFPEAKLNYAENIFAYDRKDDDVALYFWGEDKIKSRVTFGELYDHVSQMQQFFVDCGVGVGDRVAAILPNMPKPIICMLAAASLGATWSSASPDFGVQGVLDRFGQIEPKVLIAIDGYYYNGKWIDCLEKLKEIIPAMPSLNKVLLVPYDHGKTPEKIEKCVLLSEMKRMYKPKEIAFTRVPFNHPLFIMFSSGTTGKPKCIVHGVGGTLLQHLKEQGLQCNLNKTDKLFQFTTCGWMMWNMQVSALALGVTLCLYDGSPFAPNGNILWDYVDAVGTTAFGTGAKYIDMLHKQQYKPMETHDLSSLKILTSTGSVLVPESFDYIYRAIKKDLQVSSICGGTDIISSFMMADPTKPVYRGELQCAGLGMAVDVFRPDGSSADIGEKGEMVCTKPFVSMPVGFWNDPDGAKYHKAYFERFENIWHHGDYVEKTPHGGFIVYGRSDATLNPGGVRIGTAELYNQVEKIPEILESVVVGQKWDDDERVVLFVRMQPSVVLDDALIAKIRKQIREGASPRHVPSKIIPIADIPRTKNNKVSEIAVRDTINGLVVANTEALANPDSLELYRNLPELQTA